MKNWRGLGKPVWEKVEKSNKNTVGKSVKELEWQAVWCLVQRSRIEDFGGLLVPRDYTGWDHVSSMIKFSEKKISLTEGVQIK